jgi:hypothetical protein
MTKALAYSGEPAYVRMGRGDVEDVYTVDCPFEIGKANVLRTGAKAAIIACGEMVYPSLKAAEILGVDPERCVVIEDSGVGVASGVAAGMKVLALDRSSSVPQTFVGETWKVDDLSEIDFDREFT